MDISKDPAIIQGLQVFYQTSGDYTVTPKWSHVPAPIASRIAIRIASPDRGDSPVSRGGGIVSADGNEDEERRRFREEPTAASAASGGVPLRPRHKAAPRNLEP